MSLFIRLFVLSLAIACAATLVFAQNDDGRKMDLASRSLSSGVLPAPVLALTSGLVSSRRPDGLILSEGNMYFTSHDAAGAAVWRTAQSSSPGAETVLYWEPGARFGDIVFAKVNGTFFGYFFATKAGVITIKRVPLTGGAATTLATVTNIDVENSHRNLVTDGVNLYWQDVSAVRKMPISGGAITLLDNTQPNTPSAGIALQAGRVIYASVSNLRFVPTSGAITSPSVRTIVSTTTPVTAIHVVSNGIYWGERSGAVRLRVGGTITTLPSIPSLGPTSISSNGFTAGAAQSYTQCGSQSCRIQFEFPALTGLSMPTAAGAFGVSVTSSGVVYWGDATGVHRKVF